MPISFSRVGLTLILISSSSLVALAQPSGELSGIYTIQQKSSARYLDAYVSQDQDYGAVTRPWQGNATQKWILSKVTGTIYTIQQQANGRYLDAHLKQENDFCVVTRAAQNDATQRWVLTKVANDTYTIQQRTNGRYLDAHQQKAWKGVTREYQPNTSQHWIIKRKD